MIRTRSLLLLQYIVNFLHYHQMNKEIEVKFLWVDHNVLRTKLKALWGICVKPNTLMRRTIFHDLHDRPWYYMRVRDEGDTVTFNIKHIKTRHDLHWVHELELVVGEYETMIQMLLSLWHTIKSVQETRREKRMVWEVEVCLDERPGLRPFVEIEWAHEDYIRALSHKLWFDFDTDWRFWTVCVVAEEELWMSVEETNAVEEITFEKPLTKR